MNTFNNNVMEIVTVVAIIMFVLLFVWLIIQIIWGAIQEVKESKERRQKAKRLWDENVKIRVRIRRTDHWDGIIHQVFQWKTAQDYTLSCFEEMFDGGYLIGADGTSCRMIGYYSEEED